MNASSPAASIVSHLSELSLSTQGAIASLVGIGMSANVARAVYGADVTAATFALIPFDEIVGGAEAWLAKQDPPRPQLSRAAVIGLRAMHAQMMAARPGVPQLVQQIEAGTAAGEVPSQAPAGPSTALGGIPVARLPVSNVRAGKSSQLPYMVGDGSGGRPPAGGPPPAGAPDAADECPPCSTPGCPCVSYCGLPGYACSLSCRDHGACKWARHPTPSMHDAGAAARQAHVRQPPAPAPAAPRAGYPQAIPFGLASHGLSRRELVSRLVAAGVQVDAAQTDAELRVLVDAFPSATDAAAAVGPMALPTAPPVTDAARGREILDASASGGADLAALLAVVPMSQLDEVCSQAAQMFSVAKPAGASWSPWVMIPPLSHSVAAAASRAGSPAAVMLAAKAASPSLVGKPLGQVMCVLSELAATLASRHLSGSASGASAERKALDRIGARPAALQAVRELAQLPAGEELREQARAAELSSVFGADIATILHQENLSKVPTGDPSLTHQTREAWDGLYAIRPRLLVARKEFIKVYTVSNVLVPTLVTAIATGALTVEVLTGGKSTDEAGLKTRRLSAVWPALIEAVRTVTPRDTTAPHHLLVLGRELNEQAASDATRAVSHVLEPVLAVFAERAALFHQNVTSALPAWSEAIAEAREDQRRRLITAGASGSQDKTATEALRIAKSVKATQDAAAAAARGVAAGDKRKDAAAAEAEADGGTAGTGGSGTPKKK